MAIDPKTITTDITLELDEEEITIAEFSRAFESFFGLVREVSKEALPKQDSGAWLVSVYPGSAGIGVSPKHGAFGRDDVARIRSMIVKGVRLLESGERPAFFSDKAIEHSKSLGTLFKNKKAPANVRIWSEREEAIPIKRDLAVKASAILDADYEHEGTVEGKLEKLNAHGKLEFVVYDEINNRAIKCEVQEKQLEKAWENFRKRVEVTGRVSYRKDGLPVSIKATAIEEFPSPEEIPSLGEMRRLLAGG